MELETVNKLYLELSQIVTAKTARELELEDLLRACDCRAQGRGHRVGAVCSKLQRTGHWISHSTGLQSGSE